MTREAVRLESAGHEGGRRPGRLAAILGLLAVGAFIAMLVTDPDPSHDWFPDRFAAALKNLTSGFPGAQAIDETTAKATHTDASPYSPWYALAQHAAAVVALWGLIAVIYSIYREAFDRRRAWFRKNHVVVCGLGEKGLRAARGFGNGREKVTCIDLDAASDAALALRSWKTIVLRGDATQRYVLEAARVDRAKAVVCAAQDDAVNAAIAARVRELVPEGGKRRPVAVYAHIKDPEMARALDAHAVGVEPVRLEFFNIYDLWAQAIVAEIDLAAYLSADPPPQIIIVGSTDLGQALLVWMARRWHSLGRGSADPLLVTFVAADATAVQAVLERRFPALGKTLQITAIDQDVSSANPVHVQLADDAAHLAAICSCLFDESENLGVALQARRELPAHVRVIVPESAWTVRLAALRLDPGDLGSPAQIQAVGYSPDADSLDLLKHSPTEIMAREIHAEYLEGDPSDEAGKPWNELEERYRDSSRAQARGLVRLLRAIWYDLTPLSDWSEPSAVLPPLEVEGLAELEHMRWFAAESAAGREYGPVRSEKHHPNLLEWRALPEEVREKDRNAVRHWPENLARIGYRLGRSPLRERLAREIHERHRASRLAAGDTPATRPMLIPWEDLSPEQREPSLASADDIGLKLARIGCRVVPASSVAIGYSFSAGEVETLAELEHERWCTQKLATGWKLGAYSDSAKLHPNLVAWSELGERERQIDRDHVLALPSLLAKISRRIVRDPDAYG